MKTLVQSQHLNQLQKLDLMATAVTDVGMDVLARCRNAAKLKSLNFYGTRITDAGVKTIAQSSYMSGLEHLDLGGCDLTNVAVEALAQSPYLTKLDWLSLTNCNVTNPGVEALAQSPCLSRLTTIGLGSTHLAIPHQLVRGPGAVRAQPIFRYLRESSLGGPLLEVKVPILGMGSIGKSLLMCRFSATFAFRENNPTTHAFETKEISLAVDHGGRSHECCVRLFDFGGQLELHSAHRFFLADKAQRLRDRRQCPAH